MTQTTLHLKYRPTTLDTIIGHDAIVTRLQGMLPDQVPAALAFFGPTSVGKTTLARAFAATVNEVDSVTVLTDYREMNAATQKGIDDIRELERVSRFRPARKRRFLVLDECQMLLSNNQAANAWLKSLEEPAASTTWIVCSMEPSKFRSTETGRAILNRCTQFILKPPDHVALYAYAVKIARGEKMNYLDKAILNRVIDASGGEMRTVANLLGGLQQYARGLQIEPGTRLSVDDVADVLSSSEASGDDVLVARALKSMYAFYAGKGKEPKHYLDVVAATMNVSDPFMFVKSLQRAASFMVQARAVPGGKHSRLLWLPVHRTVLKENPGVSVHVLVDVMSLLVRCTSSPDAFNTSPVDKVLSELSFGLYPSGT